MNKAENNSAVAPDEGDTMADAASESLAADNEIPSISTGTSDLMVLAAPHKEP